MKQNRLLLLLFLFMISSCAQHQIKNEDHASNLQNITPPMGWNSWICFGTSVTEEEVKANGDFMAENLKEYGWEYIIIDAGWYAPDMVTLSQYEDKHPHQVIDKYGRLIPDTIKYPSAKTGNGLKPIANYLHNKGLKMGIHIMRGIPIQAVEQNTPIKGTKYFAKDIVLQDSQCEWYFGFYGIDMSKPGAQEYYNSLFELYESWDIDYIKADDLLGPKIYCSDEIAAIGKAIKSIKRPIVLSLSPGPAPLENVKQLQENAQLWRISEDFWDDWNALKAQFPRCRKWAPLITEGHYPDADMLPIGPMAQRAMRGSARPTHFTHDEQYTMLSLWAICRSPLMVGCNLPEIDRFTLQLITNKEVIALNQNSKNNQEWYNQNGIIGWYATSKDEKAHYIAFFNTNDKIALNFSADLSAILPYPLNNVTEIWQNKNISCLENQIKTTINPHGVVLFKLTK